MAIREEGLCLAVIAEQTGTSAQVLRAYLESVYRGDTRALTQKLDACVRAKEECQRAASPQGFVHTSHSKRIYAALRLVHEQGGIGAIYGDPGTGKTITFRAYRNDCPTALLIVDEAQHLTHEALDLLRCLVDTTEARQPAQGRAVAAEHLETAGRMMEREGNDSVQRLPAAMIRLLSPSLRPA